MPVLRNDDVKNINCYDVSLHVHVDSNNNNTTKVINSTVILTKSEAFFNPQYNGH